MDESGSEPGGDVAAAVEKVAHLDFTDLNKLLQTEDPEFWTDSMIADTEKTYRRFLVLNLLYPAETIAVNSVLDEYWHHHILDTQKYAADCEEVFGSFLHHFPYFGTRDENDRQMKLDAFAVTNDIWEQTFGTSLIEEMRPVGEARLTLDKVLGGVRDAGLVANDDIFAAPKSCKNGQHCQKVIGDVSVDQAVVAISE